MRMDRRRLSGIDQWQHPAKDPKSHTCAVFQMESVSVEWRSTDQDRVDFFSSMSHSARLNLFLSVDDVC